MRRAAIIAVCAAALCCTPRSALALLQSCTVAATPIAFGTYNPAASTALAGTGTVTVTCTVTLLGLLESWTISLSSGNSGNFSSRQMSNAGRALTYNLYTTAADTQIWGNGSSGTGTVSDSQLLSIGTNAYPYTVYGRVNTLQDLPAGTYSDLITVTVNY